MISLAGVALLVGLLLVFSRSAPQGTREEIASPSASSGETQMRLDLDSATGAEPRRVEAEKPGDESALRPADSRVLAVAGAVTDARTRAALSGVAVVATLRSIREATSRRFEALSDAYGRYSIELDLPADVPWDPRAWIASLEIEGERFRAERHSLEPADFEPDPTTPGRYAAVADFEVEIDLVFVGRIARSSDGLPIPGGTATLLRLPGSGRAPEPIENAVSDEAGRFKIARRTETPGDLAVFGAADGYRGRMVATLADPSRVVDVGDIALAEGACIEGVVTAGDGFPLTTTSIHALARIPDTERLFLASGSWTLRDGEYVRRFSEADLGSDGRFRVCGLAAVDHELRLAYPGCRTGSSLPAVNVRAPATGVRFQASEAVYRFRVLDEQSGTLLPRARFFFDDPADLACWLENESVIGTDPGSSSNGRVTADGYRSLPCTLPPLEAGELRELEVRLRRLPELVAATIVVLAPTGEPVENVEIEIRPLETDDEGQAPIPRSSHQAPDGRHLLPEIAPGHYDLVVEPQWDWLPRAEFWLGAGVSLDARRGMEPVEVRLGSGGLVRASVTRAGGGSVDARTWLLRAPSGEPERIDWRDDAGGSYGGWIPKGMTPRLRKPLPAGRFVLRFEADGMAARDVPVDVLPGGTAELQVVLDPQPPR